jgi:hypothetical protein
MFIEVYTVDSWPTRRQGHACLSTLDDGLDSNCHVEPLKPGLAGSTMVNMR